MIKSFTSSLKMNYTKFFLYFIITFLPFSLLAQDWNNCGGNSSRNGLSPIPGPQTADIKWQGTLNGLFAFPVYISDDKVVTSRFVSITNSPVVCHDLNTGQLLWSADVTNGTGRSVPLGMRDGKVYVLRMLEAPMGDSLVTLDAETGLELWHAEQLIDPSYTVGLTFADNGDLLIEGYLTLLRINATDGSTVWETSIYPYVLGYLCPTVYDSTVYVQQNAVESVTAMDINTGNIKYSIPVEPSGQNSQTILMTGTDGTLYAQTTGPGGQITAIKDDGNSLTVLWTTPTTGYAPFSYMAESPDSTIYVPSNGKILRLLKTTGAIIDSSSTLGNPGLFIETISVGADGKVYIASDYTFQCTNPDLTPVFTETIYGLNTTGCALGPNHLLAIAGSGTELRVYGPTQPFVASATAVCQKFCIDFFDSSTTNPIAWQWNFEGGTPSSSTDENPTNICYQVPGIYDVTLITTTANGNDTVTLQDYIVVNETPPFPTITQVDYTLTSSPANSYQWQLNAEDIPGATDQSYTVLQSGTYTIVISDSNGCINSTSLEVIISGMNDITDASEIFVYPNPSKGIFTVNIPQVLTQGFIEIFNAMDQVVYSNEESTEPKQEIDLTDQSSGVYILRVNMEDKIFYKKILITK